MLMEGIIVHRKLWCVIKLIWCNWLLSDLYMFIHHVAIIHNQLENKKSFYPTTLKGSGVLSYPERVGGPQGRQAPLTLSRP